MQRDRKGGQFTVLFAKRLDLHTGSGHPMSVALVPPRQRSSPDNVGYGQQQQLRCQRCRGSIKVMLSSVAYEYNCWRCGYPTCCNCRVAWPRAISLWVCNSCMKPVSLSRLFETTSYGAALLLRVLEYCDSRAARIINFLFPALALQHVGRRDTVVKQPVRTDATPKRRQVLVKRTDTRPHFEATGGGVQRRVLVDAPPLQKLVRAKTAARRYSPVKGSNPAPVRAAARSFSPQNVAASFAHPCNDCGSGDSERSNAPDTQAAVLHRGPHDIDTSHRKLVEDCTNNKFLRSGPSKGNGLLVDVPRISNTQTSPISSQLSDSKSDSPPPRFPSFSQFLDEMGSAQHLQLQTKQQQQQQQWCTAERYAGAACGGDTLAAGGALVECVDLVELGTRPSGHDSTLKALSNPRTPPATGVKKITISPEPVNRRQFCNPPPQLRTTPAKSSISQRRITTNSGSRATTTTTTTTARTATASFYNNSTTINNNSSCSQSSMQFRLTRGVIDSSNTRGARPCTSRTWTSRQGILTDRTTPRPLGVSTASTCTTAAASIGGRSFGAYNAVRTAAHGLTTEEATKRKNMGTTSPRFTRRPTACTPLTGKNASPTFSAPMTSRVGTRTKVASPIVAHPAASKRTKPPRAAATPSVTSTPLQRTNTATRTRTRNMTPRASGTRTPLQRIASSRLMPSEDTVRRYLPLRVDAANVEPPQYQVPPPPPSMLVHMTRPRPDKSTTSRFSEEPPQTARSARPMTGFQCRNGSTTPRPTPKQLENSNV